MEFMELHNSKNPGKYLLFILSAVLMQSLSYGYVSRTMDEWSALFFVFCAFLSCSLFYLFISTIKGAHVEKTQLRPLLWLNASTALAFVCFYWSISYIPASISSLVEAAVGPLWVVVLSRSLKNKEKRLELAVAAAVTVCAVLAANNAGHLQSPAGAAGLSLSILAGGGAAFIAIFSQKTEKYRLKTETVLAHRFHFTWLIAAVLLTWHGKWNAEPAHIAGIVLVAVAGVVVPMYFLQLGMQRCQPIVTMLCLSIVPVVTYGFELGFGETFQWDTFILLLMGVSFSCCYLVYQRNGANPAETRLPVRSHQAETHR